MAFKVQQLARPNSTSSSSPAPAGVCAADRTVAAAVVRRRALRLLSVAAVALLALAYYVPSGTQTSALARAADVPAATQALGPAIVVQRVFLPVIFTYPPRPAPTPSPAATPLAVLQLVVNGGFEDAAPQSPPWQQEDLGQPGAWLVSDFFAHGGTWSVSLGELYSNRQRIWQTISVPQGTRFASVLFHWYMNTEDSLDEPHDILSLRLLNEAGETIATVLQRDNTSRREAWVATRYTWDGDFPFAGQTIRLSFDMATDGDHSTNIFLDDVSFEVSAVPGAGAGGEHEEDATR